MVTYQEVGDREQPPDAGLAEDVHRLVALEQGVDRHEHRTGRVEPANDRTIHSRPFGARPTRSAGSVPDTTRARARVATAASMSANVGQQRLDNGLRDRRTAGPRPGPPSATSAGYALLGVQRSFRGVYHAERW